MPKHAFRSRLLEQRRQLTAHRHQVDSLAAQQSLLEAEEFSAAKKLGLYSPVQNEVATKLLQAVAESAGKTLVYPRVRGDHLEFVVVGPGEKLVQGSFGVCEPTGSTLVDPNDLDLLVLPGVAFDRRGHRLGYGKGYYDRALAGPAGKMTTVGLAFGFQQVDLLPNQAHDVRLMMLATEAGLVRFAAENTERG